MNGGGRSLRADGEPIRRLMLGLLMCSALSSVVAGPLEDGTAAYERKDYATALRLWTPLASKGDAPAQHALGKLYARGVGVLQDKVEARKWYQRAAVQGYALAQYDLGLAYGLGAGVARDVVLADMWLLLAASNGDPNAMSLRSSIRMTPQQRAQAQAMAKVCKSTNYRQCADLPEFASAPPAQPELSQEQIEPKKSYGTGFYVSSDGYLVTNEHVVESCAVIAAIDAAGQRIPVRIVRVLKTDDLALLEANTEPYAFAIFRESTTITQGESVVAYGFPLAGLLASSGNVSTGLVTALAGIRDNARQIQISAPVQPGNSGGPLVDSKGLVIGVVVSKLDAIAVAKITSDIPQNINFAVKAISVINLFNMSSVPYRSANLQRDLSVETLTQQVKSYTVKIECN